MQYEILDIVSTSLCITVDLCALPHASKASYEEDEDDRLN
jgi:hypothetical protein